MAEKESIRPKKQYKKKFCKHCNKELSHGGIKEHEMKCKLQPINNSCFMIVDVTRSLYKSEVYYGYLKLVSNKQFQVARLIKNEHELFDDLYQKIKNWVSCSQKLKTQFKVMVCVDMFDDLLVNDVVFDDVKNKILEIVGNSEHVWFDTNLVLSNKEESIINSLNIIERLKFIEEWISPMLKIEIQKESYYHKRVSFSDEFNDEVDEYRKTCLPNELISIGLFTKTELKFGKTIERGEGVLTIKNNKNCHAKSCVHCQELVVDPVMNHERYWCPFAYLQLNKTITTYLILIAVGEDGLERSKVFANSWMISKGHQKDFFITTFRFEGSLTVNDINNFWLNKWEETTYGRWLKTSRRIKIPSPKQKRGRKKKGEKPVRKGAQYELTKLCSLVAIYFFGSATSVNNTFAIPCDEVHYNLRLQEKMHFSSIDIDLLERENVNGSMFLFKHSQAFYANLDWIINQATLEESDRIRVRYSGQNNDTWIDEKGNEVYDCLLASESVLRHQRFCNKLNSLNKLTSKDKPNLTSQTVNDDEDTLECNK